MVAWRKSSYSAAQQACVEIGRGIGIRDSKTSGHLPVCASAWSAFLVAVKSGLVAPQEAASESS
jgi:hypothetical protein